MLHKMGFDCICEICGGAKTYEQMMEDDECCFDCYAELQVAAAERRQEKILQDALDRDHD